MRAAVGDGEQLDDGIVRVYAELGNHRGCFKFDTVLGHFRCGHESSRCRKTHPSALHSWSADQIYTGPPSCLP